MQTLDRGFYMRCSAAFAEAMDAATAATGLTKAELVDRALVESLPLYFANKVRAAGTETGVQNTHINLFHPEKVSEAGIRRVKKSRQR
jgi:hypothetical protein